MRYHHWSDEVPCDEALQHLDALVEFVSGRFGFAPRTTEYFKWRTREAPHVLSSCGGRFGACARGAELLTTGWAHDHEVVHTQFEAIGDPPPLFVEGIAMVYGCGSSGYRGPMVDSAVELERLLSRREWESEYLARGRENYEAAGAFVRWLLDRHGEAAFLSFFARAPGDGDDRARRVFKEVFGVPFDEAVAAWRATEPVRAGAYCVLASDPCQGQADLGPGTGPLSRALSCIGAVVSVESGPPDATAFGVTSSVRPVTTLLESCDPRSATETEALIPPDAPISAAYDRTRTPGRQLEVRAFGLGPRALLRMHASHEKDGVGYGRDPEGAPLGDSSEGNLELRALPEPERLWTPECDGGATPLGQGTWGVHLSADLAAIPRDGGALRLHSDVPVGLRFSGAVGLLGGPEVCPVACGFPADGGCASGGAASTDHSLRVDPVEDAGWSRFSLDLRVSP